jgi:chromosomal replication initiator protein
MQQFHDKYRTADVLLVDDVQFIGGKASTQEEFFHTFDALIQDNKQIVFTSDRPPKEIQQLEERVKSRFEWGLLADIQPPDIETRMAIILRKAEYCGLTLSNDVVQYIAEKIKNNIRQLEGVVKKLNAQYIISGKEPNLLAAQNAIQDILSDNQPISVQVDNILSEVARTYDTTVDNIKSEKRNANISNARKAAMYIIREVTSLPMEKIGEIFGGKHHSTVIYGINKVEEAMDNDPSVKATIESIINNVQKNNV